ncbi:MAG: hypothetical protein HOP19_07860 [Acidobacteria bacterium]|nr:hypothetical protein [Acidobacteriota bacterium]
MSDDDLILLLQAVDTISESQQQIAEALRVIDERVETLEKIVKALVAQRLN